MYSSRIRAYHLTGVLLAISAAACGSPQGENEGQIEQRSITDADSIVKRSDGNYDVTCHDGRKEVDTPDQLKNDQVCLPVTSTGGDVPPGNGPDDPFSTTACTQGSAWTVAGVEGKLPAGKLTAVLPATAFVRFATADCARRSDGSISCGTWTDVASSKLAHVELRLTDDPTHGSAQILPIAYAMGMYQKDYSPCPAGESGDLCPTTLDFDRGDFGVSLPISAGAQSTNGTLGGFAGVDEAGKNGFLRNPASILWGQAQRTATPEGSVEYGYISEGGNSLTQGSGYSLGSMSVNSNEDANAIYKDLVDRSVPDSSANQFNATTKQATTACSQVWLQSIPPGTSTASWTKVAGGILFRY